MIVRTALIIATLVAAVGPAAAAQSCLEHRQACEAVCSPARVWHYYAGSLRACTASCEPRFSECARTGLWVDLERLSSGTVERADTF